MKSYNEKRTVFYVCFRDYFSRGKVDENPRSSVEKKTSRIFDGNIWYFKLHSYINKDDSGTRTNQSALSKQGSAFTYSRSFQKVTFRKKVFRC